MENASKALIMAGGMLMAVLILTLVVISYNQIRNSSQAQQDSLSVEQVAEFNRQFEAYDRSDVTGFDLISLINKVIDYNARNSDITTSDKGYAEMTVEINLQHTGKLFTKSKYTAKATNGDNRTDKSSKLLDIVKQMQNLEKKSSVNMSTMVDKTASIDEDDWDKEVRALFDLRDSQQIPTYIEVQQYAEYLEFKRADYTCVTDYNKNTGRIIKMQFTQQ